jgi:Uncharacterized conserved protein
MRIEQLNLIDFGMFHQFTLKLDPAAQLIYGDNEQGKTTLLSFMLLMLYGDQGRDRKGPANHSQQIPTLEWPRNGRQSGAIR